MESPHLGDWQVYMLSNAGLCCPSTNMLYNCCCKEELMLLANRWMLTPSCMAYFQTLILSVLPYTAYMTLLATNMKSLVVFYWSHLRQILDTWWYQHVTNMMQYAFLWSFLSYWAHRSSLYSRLQWHSLACWWCSCSSIHQIHLYQPSPIWLWTSHEQMAESALVSCMCYLN